MRALMLIVVAAGCGGGTSIHMSSGHFTVGDAIVLTTFSSVLVTSTPHACADDLAHVRRASSQRLAIGFEWPDGTSRSLPQLVPGHYDWAASGQPMASIQNMQLDDDCAETLVPKAQAFFPTGGAGVDVRSVSADGMSLDFDALFDDGSSLGGHIDAVACTELPSATPTSCQR